MNCVLKMYLPFQLHLVTYKSSTTGKTEVAFYIFLEREDKQNIRDAMRGWMLLMPYGEKDVGGSIFIGIVSIPQAPQGEATHG